MERQLPLIFSIVALMTVSAPAATYYVSTQGSNSAVGSKASPWKTVQHACDAVKAGDTILVQPGVYSERVEIEASGTDGAWITLKADGKAEISGATTSGRHIILIENQNYIRIEGFEIRDLIDARDGSGIRVEGACDHIELLKNRIHNLRGRDAMGITVYGTNEDKPCSNLLIDGNEIFDCDPAKSEALVINGNVTDFKVTNNFIHDVNNIGIDLIGGEPWICKDPAKVARKGVVSGNRVERALSNYGGGFAAGIYVDGGKDLVIENNVVTECDMGIEIGAENRDAVAERVVVRGNKIYRNVKAGIVFGGYGKKAGKVRDCLFEKNIVYQNSNDKKDPQGELWIQWAAGNTVKDNTFVGVAGQFLVQTQKFTGTNTIDGNRWFTADGSKWATFHWQGKDFEGFQNFQIVSGAEANGTFSEIVFKDPEKGNFEVVK